MFHYGGLQTMKPLLGFFAALRMTAWGEYVNPDYRHSERSEESKWPPTVAIISP
jgi:hypothetical protein